MLSILPFILLLLCIAVIPLVAEHFWEKNRNKAIIVAIISIPVLVYFTIIAPMEIFYHIEEYFGFIVLLWSLYTISGGIVLKGNLRATPFVNTVFLAVAAVIANIFGTTGASMLLIRPVLRTNMERKYKKHIIIFFIFIGANIGGCLTPLGDPPLYMGYLNNIPFSWTFRLFPEWLFANGLLLLIFYVYDSIQYKKEEDSAKKMDFQNLEPVHIKGFFNLLLVAGVLLSIILGLKTPLREIVMIILGLISMRFTPEILRKSNHFNFSAIIEVAILFVGIFITMIPALIILEQKGGELGITRPYQFFWLSGGLSSFLDNTPTYLTFVSLAKGTLGLDSIAALAGHETGDMILRAISIGAVFMGANTYIGNGPNFMIKAISDQKGPLHTKMPSFFGYMLYSICILIPVFIAVTFIFFM
jgi:Na+/H+ antiporter NhaD/arsenite permease-like protein